MERRSVILYSEVLQLNQVVELNPEWIISYNYKYLITKEIISYIKEKIINLHISYLPWNGGSDPNIWSFIENTPKGVTIHQINEKFDKGKILYQREYFFDEEKETFMTSYCKLNKEIVELFKEKWEEMESGQYNLYEQVGEGSYHTKKELDIIRKKLSFNWNDNIANFLKRYQLLLESEKFSV